MSERSHLRRLLVVAALALLPGMSVADLRVGPLISDGMVLQRDRVIAIWGVAEAESEVTVAFREATVSGRVDSAGNWQVELPATAAGGPFEMTITTETERLLVRDILVGDVWVCSGQSNMEWVVSSSMIAAAEIELASDSEIRHFKVPRSWSAEPMDALAGGSWEPADPEHVADFTAVGYFFARDLRSDVNVPIGLVNTTWGGSRIEPWMSAGALGMDDDDVVGVLEDEREYEQEIRAELAARIGQVPVEDRGFVNGQAVWADPDLDDWEWEEISVPSLWETAGYPGMDGVAWYRSSFQLNETEAEAGVRLGLGVIDDSDTSWVNGHEVGSTELAWNEPRVYEIPPEALRPGRNVIAVRVEDLQGGGGIYGSKELLYVETGGGRRPLADLWKFAVGYFTVNLEDHKREVPTVLYNHMVHPLQRFPVKGVIWYQGESNGDRMEDAVAYSDLFTHLIGDWRKGWGIEDLPFLWVQLASFTAPPVDPGQESRWAVLRESQSAALSLPMTAQAVALDIGEALDVHPTNKQAVGYRLAQAARYVAYGKDVVYSGPTYRTHEIEGGRVAVAFDHLGGGLVARDAVGVSVRGFVIAGADRRFHWAHASIKGDRVHVWSPAVTRPVAVRYAWADNTEGANLYNREGLPAPPFRTDSWQ